MLKKTYYVIIVNFLRKYDPNNAFILANSFTKLSGRGRKELPIKLVGEKR